MRPERAIVKLVEAVIAKLALEALLLALALLAPCNPSFRSSSSMLSSIASRIRPSSPDEAALLQHRSKPASGGP